MLFEVEPAQLDAITRLVKAEMEGALELDVPIAVEIGTGRNWYETKTG